MAETETKAPTSGELVIALDTTLDARAVEIGKALGSAIPTDKFIRVIKSTIRRQPELIGCSPASLVEACEKAASDGLLIDGREAALVVFNKYKKKPGSNQYATDENGKWIVESKAAQYIPMYQGLIKRAYNSGLISTVMANIVYQRELDEDRFDYEEGDNGHIHHKPLLEMDRGKPALVYSIVRMRDGSVSREVMLWPEVLAIANRGGKNKDSKGELTGIWKSDTAEMAKKTVLRRHTKKLPMDSDMARMFHRVDDLYQDGEGESGPGEVQEPAGRARGSAASRLNGNRNEPVDDIDPETGEVLPPRGQQRAAQAAKPASRTNTRQTRQTAAQPSREVEREPVDDGFPGSDGQGDDGAYEGDVI